MKLKVRNYGQNIYRIVQYLKGGRDLDYKKIVELMTDNLEEGIIIIDSDFTIRYFNESCRDITGFDPGEAIGKSIIEVFPNIGKSNSTFHKVFNTRKPIIDQVQKYVNYVNKSVSIVTSTIPIISNGKLQGAIEIFRDLTSTIELSENILSLQNALHSSESRNNSFNQNGTFYDVFDIIGKSKAIIDLKSKISKIANGDSSVFVYGQTGTGKELVVQSIHNLSYRREKAFIAQNCGALPESLLESILFGTMQGSFTGAKDNEGLFELANGGTLFLDELNSMDLGLQAKLLRVIEDGVVRRIGSSKAKVVDVRVVAASNVDPLKLVEEKKLREDLYYRLNVINLNVPNLNDRRDDIPMLVEYFINLCNQKMNKSIRGVETKVLEFFENRDWPGNVRQLQNEIESAMNFVDGDYIQLEDLQISEHAYISSINPHSKNIESVNNRNRYRGLKQRVEDYERKLIEDAILNAKNNCAQAARDLNLPKQTLHSKIKKYNIKSKNL